jgi:N-methylhydantoinase B
MDRLMITKPPFGRVDLITTQVIGNALLTTAEEMGLTLIRTAYSPQINERADCSTAVFDSRGNVVAQAPRIPLHLGSMLGVVSLLLEQGRVAEGEMYVANDPYIGGGTHLPDITIVAPLHYQGELVGFVANIAHHADVGGMVPGSETVRATEIAQEGLRLPPTRIYADGRAIEDVINLIAANSRLSDERTGDLWAQLSANHVGRRSVMSLVERYGIDVYQQATDDLLDYSERRFRAIVRQMPDGTYRGVEYLDNDGLQGPPVRIEVAMTILNGSIHLDFTGTDPQVRTSRNTPPTAAKAAIYVVFKSLLDPQLPANSGYFRSISIHLPEGSILNPRPPAPINERAFTCQFVSEAVVQALGKAKPEVAVAGSGPFFTANFSGVHPRTGAFYSNHEGWAGALGARRGHDGIDAVRVYHSNAANLPVEVLESTFPFLIERYELREDSGGAGQWRGGLSQRRDYRILADEVTAASMGERRKRPARGIFGGFDGKVARCVLNPGLASSREIEAEEMPDLVVHKGDLLRFETAGGGGFGDPLLRDSQALERDVREERISPQAVSDYYTRDNRRA